MDKIDPKILAQALQYYGIDQGNPVLDLMRKGKTGMDIAARRSPGASFEGNGGYQAIQANQLLRELFGIADYVPPGYAGTELQHNFLPNPRSAR